MNAPTGFKPGLRSGRQTILRQHEEFQNHTCRGFIEALPGGVFILNDRREIVYLHPRSEPLLARCDARSCLGMRIGEALGCVNAEEGEQGCQTSRFCAHCGAVQAMNACDQSGEGREECNLIRRVEGETEHITLDVLAVRVESGGTPYQVFSVVDQTESRELQSLERFFFHDVLNLAGGLRSMLEICEPYLAGAGESMAQTLRRASNRLVDEIVVQKKLAEGKRSDVEVDPEPVRTLRMGEDLVWLYQGHWPNGPTIELDADYDDLVVETDRALLERVLGNMIKNAAEASEKDRTVVLGCTARNGSVRLWVRNDGVLPDRVRARIFRSSFSTKGRGRGLGTHSMKLLGERYLGGRVGFRSEPQSGTVFHIDLPARARDAASGAPGNRPA